MILNDISMKRYRARWLVPHKEPRDLILGTVYVFVLVRLPRLGVVRAAGVHHIRCGVGKVREAQGCEGGRCWPWERSRNQTSVQHPKTLGHEQTCSPKARRLQNLKRQTTVVSVYGRTLSCRVVAWADVPKVRQWQARFKTPSKRSASEDTGPWADLQS